MPPSASSAGLRRNGSRSRHPASTPAWASTPPRRRIDPAWRSALVVLVLIVTVPLVGAFALSRQAHAGYTLAVVALAVLTALLVGLTVRSSQRAMRDAVDRYRKLAELLPDGMALVDAAGRVAYANQALASMVGLANPAQMMGTAVGRWLGAPHDDGPSFRRTHTVHREDRDLSVEVSSADCQVGDQMAALLVVRDMTDRHQAEAARTASEARQRTTLHTIAEGVVLYDLLASGEARPALANAAALELLGVSLEQLQAHVGGQPDDWRVCDADGQPMGEDKYLAQRTARTGVALEGVVWGIRGHHPHEPVTWFRSSTRPVRGEAGAVTGVVLSIVDITADRAAQVELSRTHARFSALVEHGHDLITVMAADGTISYASPACQAILGQEPAGLVGEQLLSVVHPDDREHWAGQVTAVLTRADATESAECRVSDAGGGWRHIEFTLANRVHDPSVEGVVCTGRDVTERVDAAARLAYLANHDNLTNLPNRTLLLDRLHQALAHSKRTGEPCALFFLDLDHFKDVNDTLGHAAGDELLGTVAGRLREVIRADDTVARIGGDEFVILAPNLTLSAAGELAERMRCSLDEPVLLGRNSVSVTASVGMALSDHHQADRLMQEADLALYRAKERGRNRWELYDAGMRAMLHHKVETEQLLRRALDEGRVVVLHQPIVDMADGRVVATEALARIEEDGRLVSPAEFIGVAEESGLIVPLGTEVLAQACAQQARWARAGAGAPDRVAVNLSARQLLHAGLVEHVAEILDAYGLDADQLCLELTESTLIDAGDATVAAIRRLKAMGVTLAIDDFGTGWSSLALLRRFPVDVLKVDRSFVSGLGIDEDDTEVVRAVISLGHALGLGVVAEGVETAEQAALLRSFGCDRAQGYFYGRPQRVGAAPMALMLDGPGLLEGSGKVAG